MEEANTSPYKTHRNYYITELPTPTQTTAGTPKTYSQDTLTTSLLPSQIFTLTNTVASKNREEMSGFQKNIQIHNRVNVSYTDMHIN